MRYRLLTIALLAFAGTAAAEIYKYRDLDGRIYFSDKPMKGDYKLLWRSKSIGEISSYPPPGVTQPGASRGWDPVKYRLNKERYSPIINEAARRVRLRPELLHAMVKAESGYDPGALSRAGARGLMQLIPETAKRYGVKDISDPYQNVDGGSRYMRDLLQMFGFDLTLALAAYNSGENNVKKYANQVPPFPETQVYVKKVLEYYTENRIATAGKEKTASLTMTN
ncbi:MAG: lytic transglycosylase domain-containing protein [Gammaproteobacteria bacterium]|nr:lytic transglycosylase domain-containing protein [Gammaproteobacteria bacterium]MBU1655460.1 lytic transglycosylase domain-containing protein [Gammaproteobacteria bacterium]MBU1962427.1 lytic transglycosylase domain-containing protein [Gammaproteobacteria bacterium]